MREKMLVFHRIPKGVLCLLVICSLVLASLIPANTAYAWDYRESIEGFSWSTDDSESFDDVFHQFIVGSWTVAPVADDNETGQEDIYIPAVMDGAKIGKLKSSNKKVATVQADIAGILIKYGLRTGSTIISGTIDGVEFSHKFTVKYTCPVSAFKVNGKSALSTFKKKNVFVTRNTLKNKKVTIKAKKGWVITKVTNTKNWKGKTKKIKNKTSYSTKISTRYPYDGISVTLKNKKTGMEQTVTYRKYYDRRYSQAG